MVSVNKLSKILRKIGRNNDVSVAFIFKNNKFLIGLRNYTPDKWKDISVWTVPGGRCDSNENLELALRREVFEEVGINNLVVSKYLGSVSGAKEGDLVYVFRAETKQEPRLMELKKFSEWKWCSLSGLPVNFINPKLLELVKSEV